MFSHISRRNLILKQVEVFRPSIFKPNDSFRNRFVNLIRRFIDLQANSIWMDFGQELPKVYGAVLDIGCGAQTYRILMPENVSYLGLDTEDAKLNFGYEVPGTLYFSGEDWPVGEASFDFVLCAEVLEHIPDPRSFVQQAAKCLKPGGGLLLTVPFSARWHFIPHDYWRFTPSGLNLLLLDAGFDSIVVHARGNPLTVACYKVMALPLMLIFNADKRVLSKVFNRTLGVLLIPLLLLVGVVANLTIKLDWGDDCLGYTVIAKRKA